MLLRLLPTPPTSSMAKSHTPLCSIANPPSKQEILVVRSYNSSSISLEDLLLAGEVIKKYSPEHLAWPDRVLRVQHLPVFKKPLSVTHQSIAEWAAMASRNISSTRAMMSRLSALISMTAREDNLC